MQKLSRRDMIKSGVIGSMGLFFASMMPSKSNASTNKFLTKVSNAKNDLEYTADFTITPKMLGITERLEVPPKGGWENWTYYLVDAAYSNQNPIHRVIYLYCSDRWIEPNVAMGVRGRMVSNWHDNLDEGYKIENWYYIRAIYKIDTEYDLKQDKFEMV